MIARIPDASAQQIVREVPRGWLGAEILRRWPVARHTYRSATTRPPRRGTVCKRWRTQCQIIRGKLGSPLTAASSSAAPTPASLLAAMKPPWSGYGARNEARPNPRPVGQPHRATLEGSRGTQPLLVRAQHWPAGPRRAAPSQAFGNSVDGGHPGWDRGRHGSRVRGQVHAALVILRRGRGRKVHGASPAQYVGDP